MYKINNLQNTQTAFQKPIKILVVDHSKSALEIISDMLTSHNYKVQTAENGAEALDKYSKFKPHLVTLSLSLPIINGYETLKRIKKMDGNAKVIMITSSEQKRDIELCLNKGAIGFISKPFTKKQLVNGITNALHAVPEKNIIAFFTGLTDVIEFNIRKLAGIDCQVYLKTVKEIQGGESTQEPSPYLDVDKIISVPKLIKKLEIKAPKGMTGYVTEIGGQQNGMLVFFIKKDDFEMIVSKHSKHIHPKTNVSASIHDIEVAEIINVKIISELANVIRRRLEHLTTKLYEHSANYSYPINKITRATFEIFMEQKTIPIEFQLWFDTSQIFQSRFDSF